MKKIIITNGRWRRWIFDYSDLSRAESFASMWGLKTEQVTEIPFFVGYTVWVGKEDQAFSEPVKAFTQRPYDVTTLFV